MRNIIILSILFTFIISCSSEQKKELSKDEILEKFIESFGNKEKIMNIKTYSTEKEVKSKYGIIKAITKIKYPDRVYQQMTYPNGAKVTYIVNGNSGIIKSPKGIEIMSKDDILGYKFVALIFPEVHYKERAYSYELSENTVVNEKEYYTLILKTDFSISNYLIDQDTYEVYRIIDDKSIYEVCSTIKIDDISLIETSYSISGNDTIFNRNFNSELNMEIDDAIFNMYNY